MKKPSKLKYPNFEAKYPWLSILFKAYYRNDVGIYKELKIFTKESRRKIACKKGCFTCCLNPVVPITLIELMGISWYISEIIDDFAIREQLKGQMLQNKETPVCPFLINNECSIYPIRPIACREFFMTGLPCRPNEDPIVSRPNDIWFPSRNIARKTAMELLSFYDFQTDTEKLRAYEAGYISQNSSDMHSIDWSQMISTMNLFETA